MKLPNVYPHHFLYEAGPINLEICFILPISIPPVSTGGWKQPPRADRQSLNKAMPPVLTGGSLLFAVYYTNFRCFSDYYLLFQEQFAISYSTFIIVRTV